jgi:hypothetical protein
MMVQRDMREFIILQVAGVIFIPHNRDHAVESKQPGELQAHHNIAI